MRSAGDLACPAMPEILRPRNLTKAITTTQPANSMAYLRLIEFAKPSPAEHRLARTRRGVNQPQKTANTVFYNSFIITK
jgi:hypothetical protein